MRNFSFAGRAALAAAVAALLAVAGVCQAAESPELKVRGMTFVGSRGDASEIVVRAAHAVFHPDTGLANLEHVRASLSDDDKGENFRLSCDNAELNVETNDFTANGNVEGVTGDGRTYTAPWVRYEHDRAMLYTDAPVVVSDSTGRLRGDGFRYHIEQRRFELLGNVTVEQGG